MHNDKSPNRRSTRLPFAPFPFPAPRKLFIQISSSTSRLRPHRAIHFSPYFEAEEIERSLRQRADSTERVVLVTGLRRVRVAYLGACLRIDTVSLKSRRGAARIWVKEGRCWSDRRVGPGSPSASHFERKSSLGPVSTPAGRRRPSECCVSGTSGPTRLRFSSVRAARIDGIHELA
jgi:hypothetical protein